MRRSRVFKAFFTSVLTLSTLFGASAGLTSQAAALPTGAELAGELTRYVVSTDKAPAGADVVAKFGPVTVYRGAAIDPATLPKAPTIEEITAAMSPKEAVEYAIKDAQSVHLHALITNLQWNTPTWAQGWKAEAATEASDREALRQLQEFARDRGVKLDILAHR